MSTATVVAGHKRGVLVRVDVHAVGVGHPEPLSGHRGHRGAAVGEGVLVVRVGALVTAKPPSDAGTFTPSHGATVAFAKT
jgi:hypothetical protein